MINGKTVLALTPARGGSKGLPGKNIKSFCGKPLLSHAIDVAKSSRYVDDVFVSTDCMKIASVATTFGAQVCLRPEELATDTALVADVIRDFIARLDRQYDYIVLLEATSPLRTVEQVDQCIELMNKDKADSVATFSRSDPPPTRLWKINGGAVNTYLVNANPWLPRQMQDDAYHLNGLVYAFDVQAFLELSAKSVFFGKGLAVITDGYCVDIDTEEDFQLAEYLLRKKNAKTI